MTPRFYITILTITFCLTTNIVSLGQSQNNNSVKFDTSKTTIINTKTNYPFGDFYRPAKLTQQDIADIDSLLIACVTDYNNSLHKENKQWGIDLKKYDYKKQLIAVTNKNGEKEVWVNCFCSTWGSDKWKTEIMQVDDGGNCYFNFKINLTRKKFYNLIINGEA